MSQTKQSIILIIGLFYTRNKIQSSLAELDKYHIHLEI